MAAIFCIALLAIWRNNRALNYIRVFGLSYAVRSLCFGIFYFAFSLENPVLRYSANIFLLFAIMFLSIGLSSRRLRPPRYGALLAVGVLTLLPLLHYQFMDPNLLARVIILNCGLALLSVLMLRDVVRGAAGHPGRAGACGFAARVMRRLSSPPAVSYRVGRIRSAVRGFLLARRFDF